MLVRPVGMSDDQAEEWLVIAARAVSHLPLDILQQSCAEAQGIATHHGQIVPAILKAGNARFEERKRHVAFVEEFEPAKPLPAPPAELATADDLRELQGIIDKAASAFRDAELDRWAERRAEQASAKPKVKIDPDTPQSLGELVAKWDAKKGGEEGGSLQ